MSLAVRGRARCRILHTSDLQVRMLNDEGCRYLEKIVDLALVSKAGLVIIAGDFFDSDRIDGNVVSFITAQLQRLPVNTLILPGNHDCLVPTSVYNKVELWRAAANVRIFRAPEGETMVLPDSGVSIWGKPITSYDSGIRPLAGMPQPEGDGHWHIAVAHGYYVGAGIDSHRSLQISEEEIVTSGRDYIALGHWPMFDCVCDEPVSAYYCGSPAPMGAAVIVDLEEGQEVQVDQVSLAKG